MRLSHRGELRLVRGIREGFPSSARAAGVLTGIGDDAAVLSPPRGMKLLVSTDMMLEGVHFDLAFSTPRQAGFKLVSANVSDISAMAGKTSALLVGLAAPGDTPSRVIDRIFEGIAEGLGRYNAALVGGDVSASTGGICLCATVIGYAGRPVLRSGAVDGDMIYVTGPLGDAACGLELMKRHGRPVDLDRPHRIGSLGWDVVRPLIARHLMPEARPAPKVKINAMMDISDGLSIDLFRLCEESGCGARIEEAAIPLSDALREASSSLGLDPLTLALDGGEDYELLFTMPHNARPPKGAVAVGRITAPRGGLRLTRVNGRSTRLKPAGYRHFG